MFKRVLQVFKINPRNQRNFKRPMCHIANSTIDFRIASFIQIILESVLLNCC